MMPPRAAVRWSLDGQHSGWGRFGVPTHARIYVMGITHVEFGPHGIRREWTLIDETAIWKTNPVSDRIAGLRSGSRSIA